MAYLLLVTILLLPYVMMLQIVTSDNYSTMLLAPLWQYFFSTPDYANFAISPFALIYIIWFWPSLYMVKLAYDATTKKNLTRWEYDKRVVLATVFQVVFNFVLPPGSGYPPPVYLPLPFAGIIALIFTYWIIPKDDILWPSETEDESVF